jgi:hypothetical protein
LREVKKMKKIILFFVVGSLIFGGLGASGLRLENESVTQQIHTESIDGPRDYTHTVLVEYGSRKGCPSCPATNSAWKSIYASGNYDFEYVGLIYQQNPKASQRFYSFNPAYVPTSYWDGGEYVYVGTNENTFKNYLDASGSRSVPDLIGAVSAIWLGNAKIDISISVENDDNNDYSGTLRVYVVELVSRWTDYNNQPYGHALLDFPWEQSIDIDSGDTFEDNKVWDGGSVGYSDIDPENIQVILTVCDDEAHQSYSDPPSGNPFNAYYVDETIATLLTENDPPNQPTITGPTDGEPGIEYEYTIEMTDPEEDDLSVWIDWGDETQGWLGPYPSGETLNIMHSWDINGVYEVRVKTRDQTLQESEWSETIVVSVGNLAPNKPTIDGPKTGLINSDIEIIFSATDPNSDDLYYYIEWGDGTSEEWIGPHSSGAEVKLTHSWDEERSFGIKAKVKDTEDEESGWTTHVITIPRSKSINTFMPWLFQRFPILRILFQLF